jgi:hypothetical protein
MSAQTDPDSLMAFLDSYETTGNTEPQAQQKTQPPKPVDPLLPPPSAAEVHTLRQQVNSFNGMVAAMYEKQLRQESPSRL